MCVVMWVLAFVAQLLERAAGRAANAARSQFAVGAMIFGGFDLVAVADGDPIEVVSAFGRVEGDAAPARVSTPTWSPSQTRSAAEAAAVRAPTSTPSCRQSSNTPTTSAARSNRLRASAWRRLRMGWLRDPLGHGDRPRSLRRLQRLQPSPARSRTGHRPITTGRASTRRRRAPTPTRRRPTCRFSATTARTPPASPSVPPGRATSARTGSS